MSTSLAQRTTDIISYMSTHGATNEADRIKKCRTENIIYWIQETAEVEIHPKHCNSRWCPICGPARRAALRDRLKIIFDRYEFGSLRFLTLTQRAKPGEPCKAAIDRIKHSFRRLTSSKIWKENVTGYFCKLEIEYNHKAKWWHAHMHVLAHGNYIPQVDLAKTWNRINKDKVLIDIRACDASAKAELSKYMTKYKANHNIPWGELVEALRNTREFTFGGDFRSLKPISAQPVPSSTYLMIGSLRSFFHQILENGFNLQKIKIFNYCYSHRALWGEGKEWLFRKLLELRSNYLLSSPPESLIF